MFPDSSRIRETHGGTLPQISIVDVSGEACYAPEYHLQLYYDVCPVADGTTHTFRTELYDIQIGMEPEVGSVGLSKGLVVQESLCASCAVPRDAIDGNLGGGSVAHLRAGIQRNLRGISHQLSGTGRNTSNSLR